ncbi:uncharacterized protein LOC117125148 [Anneissia japonica]|uniref:uncharacterized protein LOC117125148 n=1 Tax=Anneissia japonica TaxID=1529436 RepID=UPI0014255B49|nr:uncharacterized protein LOC117125148 [Anneissia japonica]
MIAYQVVFHQIPTQKYLRGHNSSFGSLFSGISSNYDNDISFHPSDADTDNEESEDEFIEEHNVNFVSEMKYVVFNSQLKQLFNKCLGDNQCAAPVVELDYRHKGSLVIVNGTCLHNHHFEWRSQPLSNKMAIGNLLLAASILYSGNTYTTAAEFFDTFKLKFFSENDFYYIQRKYLLPVVNSMWNSQQQQLLSEYEGNTDLIVAGDGRSDSPGHSAAFGTYSLMDTKTNAVLATSVVKVTEVNNSYSMEKEGLIRCLNQLEEAHVTVTTLATERHPQISKLMKDEYSTISHQYDVWHMSKSIKKKRAAAAKRRECAELQPWIKSIGNHFW